MPLTDSKPDALSSVYARSIYELANESGGREADERVVGEFEDILELARENHSFSEVLSSRVLKQGDRTRSLKAMFEGQLSDLTLRSLLVLNENGRLGHLIPIVTALDETAQAEFGRVEVDLYTAEPVDASELSRIKDQLNASLGREAVVHPYTDPSMIGGVKLQIGDTLIDASVATRLNRMRQQFATEGSARLRAAADRAIDRSSDAG